MAHPDPLSHVSTRRRGFPTTPPYRIETRDEGHLCPPQLLRLTFRRDGGDFDPTRPPSHRNVRRGASLPTPIPVSRFNATEIFDPPPPSHIRTHFHGYGFAGIGEPWEPQGYHWAVFVLGCLLPVHGRPTRKWAHPSTSGNVRMTEVNL